MVVIFWYGIFEVLNVAEMGNLRRIGKGLGLGVG